MSDELREQMHELWLEDVREQVEREHEAGVELVGVPSCEECRRPYRPRGACGCTE